MPTESKRGGHIKCVVGVFPSFEISLKATYILHSSGKIIRINVTTKINVNLIQMKVSFVKLYNSITRLGVLLYVPSLVHNIHTD